jgi:NADPH:quinone reductase-like Zn-dependent oxidoreductase
VFTVQLFESIICFVLCCSVKNEGTVIIVAFASGKVPRVAAHHLFPHAPTVTGVSLPHYRAQNPKLFKRMCDEAVELNKRGLISPRVSYHFPFNRVNEAIAAFSDAQKTGKILISMDLKEEEEVAKKPAADGGKSSESKEKKK